jgi:hypothetical protein
MFSPLHGFLERELMGMFKVNFSTPAGIAVDVDPTNTAPLSGSVYGAIHSNVVAYTGTTASNNLRELGWILQPVTATGPSILNIMTMVYDESVAQGQTCVVVPSKAGALIATDQYLTSGTGFIDFSGSHGVPGAICGINAGVVRLLQTGDVPRLKLLGKFTQRNLSLAGFQIL